MKKIRKKKENVLDASVQKIVDERLEQRGENRSGFVKRTVSLIVGRLGVSEFELSRAMGVYAPDPRRPAECAVAHWCGAKKERPGKRPFALLELIFFGAAKLQRTPSGVKLVTFPCEVCGTPTARNVAADGTKASIERCPIDGTEYDADPNHLAINHSMVGVEAKTIAAIASSAPDELSSYLALATMIRCSPAGIKLWYPTKEQVEFWTEERIEELRDAAAQSMRVQLEDGTEDGIRPEVTIEQHILASQTGNVAGF